MYTPEPCGCQYPQCTDWHIQNIAALQGVSFTEAQARCVAIALTLLDEAARERYEETQGLATPKDTFEQLPPQQQEHYRMVLVREMQQEFNAYIKNLSESRQ